MNLVVDHVLQALIVRGTQKDARTHESSSVAVKHGLISALLKSRLVQLGRNVLHRVLRKGSCVSFSAILKRTDFAQQTFNQLSNGHSRRNSVRVDDQVRRNRLEENFFFKKRNKKLFFFLLVLTSVVNGMSS